MGLKFLYFKKVSEDGYKTELWNILKEYDVALFEFNVLDKEIYELIEPMIKRRVQEVISKNFELIGLKLFIEDIKKFGGPDGI